MLIQSHSDDLVPQLMVGGYEVQVCIKMNR